MGLRQRGTAFAVRPVSAVAAVGGGTTKNSALGVDFFETGAK